MKAFQCLVGVRRPPVQLAGGVRDWMSRVGPSLENVQQVVTVTRLDRPDGSTALVNEWRVNPPIPAALSTVVTNDMLGWFDHSEWASDLSACAWRIEPFFMAEAIRCQGTTRFEPAMGGRGTRATFEGQLDIDPSALARLQPAWRAPASIAVELLIGSLIPQNFRRTVEAVTALLETEASADQRSMVEPQSWVGQGREARHEVLDVGHRDPEPDGIGRIVVDGDVVQPPVGGE